MLQFLWCYLVLVVVIADGNKLYKTIETHNGLIRGIPSKTLLKNIDYFAFRGIPYAEAPIGELRFKAPKPVASWKPKILDAFDYSAACIHQSTVFTKPKKENEDCLFLNVFVPDNITANEKLAVMFFMHGGGYIEGSAHDVYFGADFLIEQQVILVTVNYRLGAFGFLSLDSREYSGNMGLKDQLLALKWVHKNIGNFNGDNQRITIFGNSAGGSSTHFHMLSEESRKYFHNAIPMSGVIDNFWAMSKENDHLVMLYNITEKIGEPKQTYEELVAFLKSISIERIKELFPKLELDQVLEFYWTPVIERADADQPFILDMSSENTVSSFFGFTAHEGLMMAAQFDSSYLKDSSINIKLPSRDVDLSTDSNDYRNLINEIQEFYAKDKSDKELLTQYIQLESDIIFAYAIDKAVKIQARKSSANTFYYRFSVDSLLNLMKIKNNISIPGSSHCDELCYLFSCGYLRPVYEKILENKDDDESKISLKAIDNITKLFTNFAKYGAPSNNGEPIDGIKPVQNEKTYFIDISNDGLVVGVNPNENANKFWRYIEEKTQMLTKKQNIKRTEL